MKFKYFFLLFLLSNSIFSQTGWTWTELDTMPQSISNNAVSNGIDTFGNVNVYSFSGIDSTKLYSGIGLKSFRYNTFTGIWDTIAPLPDLQGKIAAAASTVKNKIYIIGGYHVNQNGSEVSSSKVHIYDPISNSYLADGMNIPVPIDDHVQCVWKDSLIYVVTGWSNTTNVPNVQIYDPANDNWIAGTSTPNSTIYKMFGASGVIIGDTIFYNGGVTSGFSFNATSYLRKGIIDANNPANIVWSQELDNPGDKGYRMAAANYNNRCFWIGGAGIAYNYNGIAYNGSGGVEPLNRILTYESEWKLWIEGLGAPYGIMDLRGVAQVSPTAWIICGGMESGQKVTNRAFLLVFDPQMVDVKVNITENISVYPNPAKDFIQVKGDYINSTYQVYSMNGQIVLKGILSSNNLDVSNLESGIYQLSITKQNKQVNTEFVIK